jgi:asparagine synthase (glutamine-hydrolysing)
MGALSLSLPAHGVPSVGAVDAMSAASPHRGDRSRSLVHGRCALAVVDRAQDGDAWLGLVDHLAVALVGSLDNAAELAIELAPGAAHPVSAEDIPSLLAASFRRWGDELAGHFRGVFAGVVSDGERVLAFRDHIGYRPLFFRATPDGLVVASEAKQVVVGAGIPRAPDLDVVDRIFYRDLDDETPSALLGVRRLAKSSALVVDGGRVAIQRYWFPERLLETVRYSPTDLRDRFDELMTQAVTRCLSGRDIVSLSGGIDSPAIAAYGAPSYLEQTGSPLPAQSIVYPKYPSVDERRYVELVAARFGMPLHLYEQEANPTDDLDVWTALVDTPYRGAALAQYAEDYGRARAVGATTILTGEHAEFVAAMQWFLLDHYLTHGRFGAARADLLARRARGRSWLSLGRLVARSVAPDRVMAIRNARSTRRHATIPSWIDPVRAASIGTVPVRERWQRLQLRAFIGPGISLEAEEICQAVSGVRSRKPWTDIDLWEFFLSLRAEQKFPDLRPKGLVRDLLRGRVPDEILDRTDKTLFDEAALAQVDYPTLRRYLTSPDHRVSGVDYERLAARLDAADLGTVDYAWARNLANIHAFLAQW